jgi:hypothetical protein
MKSFVKNDITGIPTGEKDFDIPFYFLYLSECRYQHGQTEPQNGQTMKV